MGAKQSYALSRNLLVLFFVAMALSPFFASANAVHCEDYLSQPWVQLRDHRRSKDRPLVAFNSPGVVRIRADISNGNSDLEEIVGYYEDWKQAKLSADERHALSLWGTARFREIHRYLRTGNDLTPESEASRAIRLIDSSFSATPPISNRIKEIYRGESHRTISIEEAAEWVAQKKVLTWESYFAASISENEAFLFARDYHAAVPISDGLFNVPLGALQAPLEQQIIYRVLTSKEREAIRAIYLGNEAKEVLLDRGMRFQVVGAENVHYISKYSPVERLQDNGTFHYWLEENDIPETRLVITLTPLPTPR